MNEASARERILDTAEFLFGDQGIRATSIRDITQRAEVNLAAVNYHFKNKEGLVAAVLARRAEPINRERVRLLSELPSPAPIEAILRCFIAPTFPMLDSNPAFLKFAARLWLEPGPELREVVLGQFWTTLQQFLGLIHEALPDVPVPELWVRFSFCIGAMLHTWTTHREAARAVDIGGIDSTSEGLTEAWIRFCAAGLRAPIGEHNETFTTTCRPAAGGGAGGTA